MVRLCLILGTLAAAVALPLTLAVRPVRSAPSNLIYRVGLGGTAFFKGKDLICVNEPASGVPSGKGPEVYCSSYKQPYKGIGIAITGTAVTITSPPAVRVIKIYRR